MTRELRRLREEIILSQPRFAGDVIDILDKHIAAYNVGEIPKMPRISYTKISKPKDVTERAEKILRDTIQKHIGKKP